MQCGIILVAECCLLAGEWCGGLLKGEMPMVHAFFKVVVLMMDLLFYINENYNSWLSRL